MKIGWFEIAIKAKNTLSSYPLHKQQKGQLTIDDTLFPPFPSSWAWEDITADYGAAPNR